MLGMQTRDRCSDCGVISSPILLDTLERSRWHINWWHMSVNGGVLCCVMLMEILWRWIHTLASGRRRGNHGLTAGGPQSLPE